MRIKSIVLVVTTFAVGVAVGGYVFSRSVPRSFLAVTECRESCYRMSDLVGLVASAGIQRAGEAIPGVELESDECIAIRHPRPEARLHLLLFPKYDIKDIGSVPREGERYVWGCIQMIGELARKHDVRDYRIVTNGPDAQTATYLHFHFRAS